MAVNKGINMGAVPLNHGTSMITTSVVHGPSQIFAPNQWRHVGMAGPVYDTTALVNRMKHVLDSEAKPTPLTGIADHPKAAELHSMHMWLLLNEDIVYPNHDAILLRKRMFNHEVAVRARVERWEALSRTIKPGIEEMYNQMYGSSTMAHNSGWLPVTGSTFVQNHFNALQQGVQQRQQTNPVKPYLIDLDLEKKERALEKAQFVQALQLQVELDKAKHDAKMQAYNLYLKADAEKQADSSVRDPGVGSKSWFSKIFGGSGV